MVAGDSVTTVPVPLKAMDCGLPEALSVIVTAPVAAFGMVGLKVIVIVQLAPTPTLVPQVFVSVKPTDAAICVMVSVELPAFVSVTVCGLLCVPTTVTGKVRLVAESCTAGPLPTPNPVKLTNCGLAGALSVIDTLAVSFPLIEGVKVTLIVQVDCGATLAVVQVLVSPKSLLFAPVMLTFVTVRFS
jgi:hypothetical protein